MIAYFAYGTTQQGFAHHRRLPGLLGEIDRLETSGPYVRAALEVAGFDGCGRRRPTP